MKTKIILLLVSLMSGTVLGQAKKIIIPRSQNGEISLDYQWRASLQKQIHLSNLTRSQDDFHLRFWFTTLVIDIAKTEGQPVKGVLTNYLQAYNEEKERKGKMYSSKKTISDEAANQIYDLYFALGMDSFPTGDSIPGWQIGFDGVTYMIEQSTPKTYSFRSYWTPSAQKLVKEAEAIENFNRQVGDILKLQQVSDQFVSTLPDGCYTSGISIMCKIKEGRKGKQE